MMMTFNTDKLDEFCELAFGHTNWEFLVTEEGKIVVQFNKENGDEE